MVIISQTCKSNHYAVYLKLTMMYANYLSKTGGKESACIVNITEEVECPVGGRGYLQECWILVGSC